MPPGRRITGPAAGLRLLCIVAALCIPGALLVPCEAGALVPGCGDRTGRSDGTPGEPARSGDTGSGVRSSGIDSLYIGPEIVVEASRIPPRGMVFNRPAFTGVLELAGRRTRIEDAAALLSRTTGVRIRRYGGLGGCATMSIRGSSPAQVGIYLDGVPLNDAWSGTADLADIALGDLDRIEIFRGVSPVGFGGSSIGGTVNLVSRSIGTGASGSGTGLELQASTGSFGTKRYRLSARGEIPGASIRAGGTYLEGGGDFAFLDDNGTPANPADDVEATRINNDMSRWNLSAGLSVEAPRMEEISLRYSTVSREAGVPGTGSNQSVHARFERVRRLAYAKVRPSSLAGGRIHLDGTAFYSWTAERFHDPGAEISLVRASTDNRILAHGGSARAALFVPEIDSSIELFLESKKERFSPSDLLPSPSDGPDRLRRTVTAAASAEAGIVPGRVLISGGLRREFSASEFWDEPAFPWLPPSPRGRVENFETVPSFGLRAIPSGWMTIKANYGLHYRTPTFFEMFGDIGTVTGSAGLEPETGENMDIGAVLRAERFWRIEDPFLEAVWLRSDIDDLILFFQNSQFTVKPKNIGSARIEGVELTASGKLARSFRFHFNYSRIESRDTGPIPYYNGNMLAGRPDHEASAGVEMRRKRWRAGWEVHVIGGNFLDRANTMEVPARALHDLSLSVVWPPAGVTLTLEAVNIGNDKSYDVLGFPLPGRSFYATIGYSRQE